MGGKPRKKSKGVWDNLENGFVRLINAHAVKELTVTEDQRFLDMMKEANDGR